MTGGGDKDPWDIDPAGVATVLGKVIGHYAGKDGDGKGGLVKQAGAFAQSIDEVVVAASSEPIGVALNEYIKEHASPEFKSMFRKIHRCVEGAGDATKAYVEGHTEMAWAAQQRALEALDQKAGDKG
jgi:hypothetical protein